MLFIASKPISRVLSFKTAIYLDVPLPTRSSRLPRATGPVICSPTALLRIEFTAMSAFTRHRAGAYLRLSTLTSSEQAAYPSLPRKRESSFTLLLPLFRTEANELVFARTQETDAAVSLCCTCPRVAPGGCYPLSLPCGARTFLTHRLSPCARGRSAHSPLDFTASDPNCQSKRAETDKSARWQILCFTSALK